MQFLQKKPLSPGEWIFTICATLYTSGLFIDGWAHNHLPSSLETFFTPWHAIFYAGFFACVATLLLWTYARKKPRSTWSQAIPAGHRLSFFGAALFAIGGVLDLLWHTVFGIEADIDALLSPTHLLLATGMTLIVSGGARHFFATHKKPLGFLETLPLTISLAATIAVLTFMAQFGHFTDLDMTGARPETEALVFYMQGLPILGSLVLAAILIGTLSIALRKNPLPFGSIAVLLTLVIAALAKMREGAELIPAAVAAGLVCDLLLHIPKMNQTLRLRIFSFILPALYQALATAIILQGYGTWWSVHMFAGAPVLAGLAGLLVSFVAWPNRLEKS